MTDDERNDRLQKLIDALPRELSPGRDLWPGIAAHLDRAPQRRWVPVAVAASLVLSALSALFTWNLYRTQQEQAQLLAPTNSYLQSLESPYLPVRATYERQWPMLKEQLDPETAAIIQRNVAIIRKASDELMEALQRHPQNPALQRLLQQTLAREVDVYRQAFDAARKVSLVAGPAVTSKSPARGAYRILL